MLVRFEGTLGRGVAAKDLILHLIGTIGAAAGTGHAVEFAGSAIRALPVEGRLTICNLAVELGAKIGMIAPDDVTFEYLAERPLGPKGAEWEQALDYWRSLPTDEEATFDREVAIDAAKVAPQVTWGTSPQDVVSVDGRVPDPTTAPNADRRTAMAQALDYMGLAPGQPIAGTPRRARSTRMQSRSRPSRAAARCRRSPNISRSSSAPAASPTSPSIPMT